MDVIDILMKLSLTLTTMMISSSSLSLVLSTTCFRLSEAAAYRIHGPAHANTAFVSTSKLPPSSWTRTRTWTRSLRHHHHHHPESSSLDEDKGKHIVLVGGGHAHLQVIKALNAKSRPSDWSVTLIDKTDRASYSGMVPGCIAKLYERDETQIPLGPLAHWADVNFIHDEVVGIDFDSKEISLGGSGTGTGTGTGMEGDEDEEEEEKESRVKRVVPYDVLSLDIGSTARGLDLPGVIQYTIPTRPIDKLVDKIEKAEQDWKEKEYQFELNNKFARTLTRSRTRDASVNDTKHIIVVGAGAAGIELAMGLRARFEPLAQKNDLEVTILDSGWELMPNESELCKEALKDTLKKMRVNVRHGCRVKSVSKRSIELELEEKGTMSSDRNKDDDTGTTSSTLSIPYTICCWATGAHPHALSSPLEKSGLGVNDAGWIRVRPTLQSVSHDSVFAAGDCSEIEGLLVDTDPNADTKVSTSTLRSRPSPPKAGVYAVRSGPILIENITRYLNKDKDKPLVEYQPQDDFLKLIMCGDGTALGFRFGVPLRGKWVWELKNHIDTMFMDLFRVEKLSKSIEQNSSKAGPNRASEESDSESESEYDTSQYDDYVERSNRLGAKEGAKLLARRDDGVDYEKAWNVIRNMMADEGYKEEVLKCYNAILEETNSLLIVR